MVAPKGSDIKVIIIDNNMGQRNLLLRLLKKEGLNVSAFDNAEAALAALDVNDPPALIITSIFIPGTDGWRLCRLLRSPEYRAFNIVPILLVSTVFSDKEAPRILADLGANAFLPLPIYEKHLIQEVRDIIQGRRERWYFQVLIVEGTGTFFDILKKTFKARGLRVDKATTAQEALKLIKTKVYNAVVIDYDIFDRTCSLLLEDIKKECPGCICFIITGNRDKMSAMSRMNICPAACILKPVDPGHLVELYERALKEHSLLYIKDLLEKRSIELRNSQSRLRFVLKEVKAGIWDWDVRSDDNNYWSEDVWQLSGLDPGSCRPSFESWRQTVLPDDLSAVEEPVRDAVNLGREFSVEWRVNLSAGPERWLMTRGKPECDSVNGEISHYRGIVIDVTDRKRAEEEGIKLKKQLLQAQKLESVGRLAGGMAHEFNKMLSVISGNTELALDTITTDQPIFEKLDEIMRAAKHSAELTRKLLAFIRRQDVEPEVINLNETIKGILKMLQRLIGEDIMLHWSPGVDLWQVRIDPSYVGQILTNLCVNASDAIEGAGLIDIKTVNVSPDTAYCASHPGLQKCEYVLMSVSDNGRGMSGETLKRLFEPFYTTKESGKGTGLGLAVVYEIVKQNKGTIRVDSKPGTGSIFKIYLPRHDLNAEDEYIKRSPSPVALGHENILLVENEPAVMETGRRMLERLGYSVLTATIPSEAICMARECDRAIQLLITDVEMPEMNGKDLADKIRSIHPGIKHLFISGNAGIDINDYGIFGNSKNFIQKPFSLSTLAVKVREALEGERTAAS